MIIRQDLCCYDTQLPPPPPPPLQWEVASSALEVLYKLLSSHELSPDHFSEQPFALADGTVAMAPQPPGHSLLVHMMNDSRLLRKVTSRDTEFTDSVQ